MAEVYLPDGTIAGCTVYQGSSDSISPAIVPSRAFDWQGGGWDQLRACQGAGHSGEPCIIYSTYAEPGCHWPGLVCLECNVVIGPLSPFGSDEGGECDPGPEHFEGHPFP
jgi:hypothetical protein